MTIVFFYTSTLDFVYKKYLLSNHIDCRNSKLHGAVCPAPFKANGWIREEAKPIEKQHQVATYLGQIP